MAAPLMSVGRPFCFQRRVRAFSARFGISWYAVWVSVGIATNFARLSESLWSEAGVLGTGFVEFCLGMAHI
jgi:hypothetical protein